MKQTFEIYLAEKYRPATKPAYSNYYLPKDCDYPVLHIDQIKIKYNNIATPVKETEPAPQKVILEFYMEIWYCYDYENGSMANPLFTSTSYELADAEAKDAGYEVVQVIEFEDEEEPAPTPTSKEGLEDVNKDLLNACQMVLDDWHDDDANFEREEPKYLEKIRLAINNAKSILTRINKD